MIEVFCFSCLILKISKIRTITTMLPTQSWLATEYLDDDNNNNNNNNNNNDDDYDNDYDDNNNNINNNNNISRMIFNYYENLLWTYNVLFY